MSVKNVPDFVDEIAEYDYKISGNSGRSGHIFTAVTCRVN